MRRTCWIFPRCIFKPINFFVGLNSHIRRRRSFSFFLWGDLPFTGFYLIKLVPVYRTAVVALVRLLFYITLTFRALPGVRRLWCIWRLSMMPFIRRFRFLGRLSVRVRSGLTSSGLRISWRLICTGLGLRIRLGGLKLWISCLLYTSDAADE